MNNRPQPHTQLPSCHHASESTACPGLSNLPTRTSILSNPEQDEGLNSFKLQLQLTVQLPTINTGPQSVLCTNKCCLYAHQLHFCMCVIYLTCRYFTLNFRCNGLAGRQWQHWEYLTYSGW